MKDTTSNAFAKRLAGEAAADLVKSGMIVGLGTGSTVAWTIQRLEQRIKEEGLNFYGVPTSYQAENLAISLGIKLTTLNQCPELDLAIDGADQVDANLFVIKGGGAAHAREKVVACSSRKFVIVADESKFVDKLSWPVPVEVLPFAARPIEQRLKDMGWRAGIAIRQDEGRAGDHGQWELRRGCGFWDNRRSKGSGGPAAKDSWGCGAWHLR